MKFDLSELFTTGVLTIISIDDDATNSSDELEEPEEPAPAPALIYRNVFDALQCPWDEDA